MGMMKLVKGEKQLEGRCTRYEGERKELIPLAAAALLSHLRFTPLDVGRTKSPSPRPSPWQHGPVPSIPVANRPPEPRCRRSRASRAPPTTVRRADLPWSPADGPTRGRHELPLTDLHLFRLLTSPFPTGRRYPWSRPSRQNSGRPAQRKNRRARGRRERSRLDLGHRRQARGRQERPEEEARRRRA